MANIFDQAGDILKGAVGPDGVKTDVKISLETTSLIYLGLTIFISVTAAVIVSSLYKKAVS